MIFTAIVTWLHKPSKKHTVYILDVINESVRLYIVNLFDLVAAVVIVVVSVAGLCTFYISVYLFCCRCCCYLLATTTSRAKKKTLLNCNMIKLQYQWSR